MQLQQVSSGRFLSGQKRMAERQRENMLLQVAEGSKFAIFKVQPCYKFRKEGDVVYDTDQILLESIEIPKHTIGGSDALFDARAADPASAVREDLLRNLGLDTLLVRRAEDAVHVPHEAAERLVLPDVPRLHPHVG